MFIIKWKTEKGIITGISRYPDSQTAAQQLARFRAVYPNGEIWIEQEQAA